MKTNWTKGMDAQTKDEMKSAFKSSAVVRARLAELIEGKLLEKERADMKADGYECANWAYKMADSQGYKRAMYEIISYITEK